jgi:hypothetical protein
MVSLLKYYTTVALIDHLDGAGVPGALHHMRKDRLLVFALNFEQVSGKRHRMSVSCFRSDAVTFTLTP